MKATVRARLTIGFLTLVTIGSVVSVAILALLSGTIEELKRVVTVSDAIEHKALEMRFDMLAMSDAMRGFLINPRNTAERRARSRRTSTSRRSWRRSGSWLPRARSWASSRRRRTWTPRP